MPDHSYQIIPEATKAHHELNFKWRSQRQTRKMFRKSIAAGATVIQGARWQSWNPRYRPHVGKKQLMKASIASSF